MTRTGIRFTSVFMIQGSSGFICRPVMRKRWMRSSARSATMRWKTRTRISYSGSGQGRIRRCRKEFRSARLREKSNNEVRICSSSAKNKWMSFHRWWSSVLRIRWLTIWRMFLLRNFKRWAKKRFVKSSNMASNEPGVTSSLRKSISVSISDWCSFLTRTLTRIQRLPGPER